MFDFDDKDNNSSSFSFEENNNQSNPFVKPQQQTPENKEGKPKSKPNSKFLGILILILLLVIFVLGLITTGKLFINKFKKDTDTTSSTISVSDIQNDTEDVTPAANTFEIIGDSCSFNDINKYITHDFNKLEKEIKLVEDLHDSFLVPTQANVITLKNALARIVHKPAELEDKYHNYLKEDKLLKFEQSSFCYFTDIDKHLYNWLANLKERINYLDEEISYLADKANVKTTIKPDTYTKHKATKTYKKHHKKHHKKYHRTHKHKTISQPKHHKTHAASKSESKANEVLHSDKSVSDIKSHKCFGWCKENHKLVEKEVNQSDKPIPHKVEKPIKENVIIHTTEKEDKPIQANKTDAALTLDNNCPSGYISDFKGGCVPESDFYYECEEGYELGTDNMCHPTKCAF